jgi:hypothetical protein
MLELVTLDTSLQLPLPRLVTPEVEELRGGLLVPPRMAHNNTPPVVVDERSEVPVAALA